MRSVRAAQLLDRGFASNGLTWLRPSLGTVDQLAPIDASPPNLRDEVCGGKHHKPSDEDDAPVASSAGGPASASVTGDGSNAMFLASGLQAPLQKPSEWLAAPPAPSEPIVVYTGPTRSGAALVAAVAADSASQDAAAKHGKRSHAAKKPAAGPKTADASAKPDAKKPDAKPAVRHANAKPAAPTDPSAAAKPAKPKAVEKPKAAAKPKTPKTSGETKPAG